MEEQLQQRLREFVQAREWSQFHSPKNLSMALASEVGELLARFRWLTEAQSENVLSEDGDPEPVLDELGDVAICLFMLCDRLGVTLANVVDRKIGINEQQYPVNSFRGRHSRSASVEPRPRNI